MKIQGNGGFKMGIIAVDFTTMAVDVKFDKGDEVVGVHVTPTDVGACIHKSKGGIGVGVGLGVIGLHVTLKL